MSNDIAAGEASSKIAVNSLIESALCLGVAQADKDTDAISHWNSKVNEYRNHIYTQSKPENCRNRLRDEGKAYPKSGCEYCKTGGLTGCPFDNKKSIAPKPNTCCSYWRNDALDNAAREVPDEFIEFALRKYRLKLDDIAKEYAASLQSHQQLTVATPEPKQEENPNEWILENLSYHKFERDDLSIDEALSYLKSEWKTVHARSDRQMVMQILALLASEPKQQGGVPDGWKLVPVEPTQEMCKAYWELYNSDDDYSIPTDIYMVMVDAAPSAQKEGGE